MRAIDSFNAFVRGAAIGAAAMYLLDPDKGRRRRAIARDKVASFACDSGHVLAAAAHDVTNRLRGVQASAWRAVHHDATPDDLQLIERVRARIGRAVSNPHAIQVGARTGRVTLSGPVLREEIAELLATTRSVPGVVAIEDRLVGHREPGSIPSLQGTPRARARRSGVFDRDAPTMRATAIVGGLALAAFGATRGSLAGFALAGLGAGLAARGARPLGEHGGATLEHEDEPVDQASA